MTAAAELTARWESVRASVADRLLPLLDLLQQECAAWEAGARLARAVAHKPRAARRVQRQVLRPPTRGYWVRHGVLEAAIVCEDGPTALGAVLRGSR